MEPTRMYVFTTFDRVERDEKFLKLRNSDDRFERQAVRFSGSDFENGKWASTYSVAWPFEVVDADLLKQISPRHGSARNPRTFPGRKKA